MSPLDAVPASPPAVLRPAPLPSSSASRAPRRRRGALVPGLGALLVVLLLGACSGSGSDTAASTSEAAGDVAAAAGAASVEGAAAAADAGADAGAPAVGVTPVPGRQVVTTGSVDVVVPDPDAAVTAVTALVEGAGGRVDALDQRVATGTSPASASMTVRVPSGALTATLAALDEVGEVGARSLTSTDVTTAATDLDARTTSLEASVARLQELIADAPSTGDVLAAEGQLTARQGGLESLRQQRALLAEQVDLSTLVVELSTEEAAPVVEPGGFLDGLGTGLDALVRTLAAALVVVGVLLPWAVVVGLLLGAWVLVRRALRRRGGRTPATGGPATGGPPAGGPPAGGAAAGGGGAAG